MSLNNYTEEALDFLKKINALNEGSEKKVQMLEEEFTLLKKYINTNEMEKIRHKIYDMLFILFELSAEHNFDLDYEWNNGREKKKKYYKQS
jgi:hypothetical protein